MKKRTVMLIILTTIICLLAVSCGIQGSLFDLYGDDVKNWAENFDASELYNCSIEYEEYDGEAYVFHDDSEMETVFNGLKDLKLGEKTSVKGSEGTAAKVIFRPVDGSIFEFQFAGDYLIPDSSGTGYKCEGLDKLPVFNGIFPEAIIED
ncbi:MAG: hypothetical protein IJI04_09340 [Lachnospiraceae bacterium]|nr:hypothetical protein [Lachnospiraceae bacterium]